jgi:hypothetical protein
MKTRKTLKRKIRALEDRPWDRQALARYGREVPMAVHYVKLWRERWQRTHKADGTMPLNEPEKETLLSMFMWPLIALDEKFFTDMAEAIRIYRQTPHEGVDPKLLQLSDPYFWLARPPLTVSKIKERSGFKGSLRFLRQLIRDLKIPHTKSKGGRPHNPARISKKYSLLLSS